MESLCLIFHFTDTDETEKVFLRGNNNYLQISWSVGKLQKYLYSFFMYTVTRPTYLDRRAMRKSRHDIFFFPF